MWRWQILGFLVLVSFLDVQTVNALYPPAFPPNPSTRAECYDAAVAASRLSSAVLKQHSQCYDSCSRIPGDPWTSSSVASAIDRCQDKCDRARDAENLDSFRKQVDQLEDTCLRQADANKQRRRNEEQQRQQYESMQPRASEPSDSKTAPAVNYRVDSLRVPPGSSAAAAHERELQIQRQREAAYARQEVWRMQQAAREAETQQQIEEMNNGLREQGEKTRESLGNIGHFMKDGMHYQGTGNGVGLSGQGLASVERDRTNMEDFGENEELRGQDVSGDESKSSPTKNETSVGEEVTRTIMDDGFVPALTEDHNFFRLPPGMIAGLKSWQTGSEITARVQDVQYWWTYVSDKRTGKSTPDDDLISARKILEEMNDRRIDNPLSKLLVKIGILIIFNRVNEAWKAVEDIRWQVFE